MNTDELVEAFITLRNERDRMRNEWEEKDAVIKEDMTKLEQALLSICNEANATSIKTDKGTVIRKLNERFFCSDWDNFRDYVLEHQALELLERRIHQGNFKEFIAEREAEGLPPGVNVMREYGVTVRKPTSVS
jgi:hypothetical protein